MLRLNRPSGGTCWVHEARLDEYLAAGYLLPAASPAPAEVEEKPKKAPAKKKAAAKTKAK